MTLLANDLNDSNNPDSTEESAESAESAESLPQSLFDGWSFHDLAKFFSRQLVSKGEWAGVPTPLPGYRLHVEDKYPYKAIEELNFDNQDEETAATTATTAAAVLASKSEQTEKTEETFQNVWYSTAKQSHVVVFHKGPADNRRAICYRIAQSRTSQRLRFAIQTIGVIDAWGLETEATAVGRLRELVSDRAFHSYMLTGSFLETSARSKVTYLFRKLRPTVAMKADKSGEMCVLAALCLHPIAYYRETFGGSMTPTDDVIAHLMLMRGDEPMYWRRANQHAPDAPQAGI